MIQFHVLSTAIKWKIGLAVLEEKDEEEEEEEDPEGGQQEDARVAGKHQEGGVKGEEEWEEDTLPSPSAPIPAPATAPAASVTSAAGIDPPAPSPQYLHTPPTAMNPGSFAAVGHTAGEGGPIILPMPPNSASSPSQYVEKSGGGKLSIKGGTRGGEDKPMWEALPPPPPSCCGW